MQIEDKRIGKSKVTFKDIKQGDCFEYHGNVWIKCQGHYNINAIKLEGGFGGYFKEFTELTLIYTKLVIED